MQIPILIGMIWRAGVTNVAAPLRTALLRTALPTLAALTIATAWVLPAHAQAWQAGAAPAATRASEWWLTALNVPAAWRAAPAEGRGVTVAVLSTGVDAGHPDLSGTVTTGPDLGLTGRKPGNQYWGDEGTAVASLIAGHGHGTGHAKGVTGVAQGARILSIQVTIEYDDPLNSDAAITRRLTEAIAQGIRYAVGHGATVIALPLDPGTLGPAVEGEPAAAGGSQAERSAVRYALAHDVLLVAPAGDNGAGTRTVNYPAAYPGVIAVGATARDGQLSPFTNAGSYIALTAPGSGDTPLTPGADDMLTDPAAGLLVAAPGGGYQSLASTDMSAALTAGVAALIRGRYPALTVAEVTRAMESGTTVPRAAGAAKAGWGHGALDAATALHAAGAIAAAHQAPAPSPSNPPKIVRAARPTGASTARLAASGGTNAGGRVRSILLDLVLAACALIAALMAAMGIARLRRRIRSAGSARSSHAAPPARPRHARTQAAPQPQPPARSPAPSTGPIAVFRPVGPRPGPARPHRKQLTDARPPWAPAHQPNETPPPLPPVKPRPQAAPAQLAPWERSPGEFAASLLPPETPRPMSNTGPMYIWNPSATTAPLRAIDSSDAPPRAIESSKDKGE